MSMSEQERALLVTGTLDTSGVGGSPYRELKNVSVAFGAEAAEVAAEEPEKAAEKSPSEPVEEPEAEKAEEKPPARKRAPVKKSQASAPAES